MIRHIIKLVWHRKRKNFLLMIEILISFMVLFAIGSMVIHNYKNYLIDRGYEYENVWILKLNWKEESARDVREKIIILKQHLKSHREIDQTALVNDTYPFSFSTTTSRSDDITYHHCECEPELFDILRIPLIQGRYFTNEDRISINKPLIVNNKMAEELGIRESVIGKVLEDRLEVVGVVNKYRYTSSFMKDVNTGFVFYNLSDTTKKWIPNYLLIRVKPGVDREFEASLMKDISQLLKGWECEMTWLEDSRALKDKLAWTPIIILVIVASFLVINVSLGLSGLLWYNINRRKSEIGLRRAMGSSVRGISDLIIYETLTITFFAILLGIFFAIQFPAFKVFQIESYVYFLSMGFAIVLIFLINYLCAWIPSRNASLIQPAVALYEE